MRKVSWGDTRIGDGEIEEYNMSLVALRKSLVQTMHHIQHFAEGRKIATTQNVAYLAAIRYKTTMDRHGDRQNQDGDENTRVGRSSQYFL